MGDATALGALRPGRVVGSHRVRLSAGPRQGGAKKPPGRVKIASRGGEPVSDPRVRTYVARRLRIGLDLAAQVRDVHPQRVRVLLVCAAPDLAEQRAVGQEAAAVAN